MGILEKNSLVEKLTSPDSHYQSILMDNNSRIMKELKELQDGQKNSKV